MRRKKFEFKPDRDGVNLANKLYLTRRQRKSLLKWTLYSLVCVLALVLQDSVLAQFRLFGAVIDLAPCALVLVCIVEGAESGGVFALAGSLFYVFSGTAPGSYCVMLLTVYSVLAALVRSSFLRRSFSATWLMCAAALVAYEMSVFGMGVFLGDTYPQRYEVFLIRGLLSAAVIPLLCPLMGRIAKVGGELWKE